MDNLERDIRFLKGVGEKRAGLFVKLGVDTVGALLRHYPRGYLDLTQPHTISSAPLGQPCAVRATVIRKLPPHRISGGRTMTRVQAGDGDAELELVYFNNRFAPAALEEGKETLFYGKVQGTLLERQMINPVTVKQGEAGGLLPQYPLTEGLSSRMVAAAVDSALVLSGQLPETLPSYIIQKYDLLPRAQAVHDIHRPVSFEAAQIARERLIFEELLTLQLGMQQIKHRRRAQTTVAVEAAPAEKFMNSLPFALTGAQRRSVAEITADMARPYPMNRLLQGDVGSGKTVVAACGIFCAAQSGYQSAVMAPTEVLANQHAVTLRRMLAPFDISVELLTGMVKGKARTALLERLAAGECKVIIGTHAVISEAVAFNRLGLVVADEQHRFGVEQRRLLSQKGDNPHLLVMSATPIPRTLALMIYGDLDVSILDERPPGRQQVKTYVVSDELRERYLKFVRRAVAEGHQAFVVCPLVEEGDETPEDLVAATEYRRELEEKYLSGLSVGLVHGRMKTREKAAVMEAFARNEISVLVSTTVIEVGIDVPGATVMIVENAERFGLSALHQLRGRVGRGTAESHCILVSASRSPVARQRLEVMRSTDNGFEIARQDLAARGPGDFFGQRQHGLPQLQLADLLADETTIYRASEAANEILSRDPQLGAPEFAPLRRQIEEMFRQSDGIFN